MAYSDHEQALRVASAISAVTTGCCLRYGLFASILRQRTTNINAEGDAFRHYYDLLRTIGLSTTEDMIHPMRTWLMCRISVPEPAERYFLQGFQRWYVEWVEIVSVEGIVLPSDPVLLSLKTIAGLKEASHDLLEATGRVRLAARPGAVSLDHVTQKGHCDTIAPCYRQRMTKCCRKQKCPTKSSRQAARRRRASDTGSEA